MNIDFFSGLLSLALLKATPLVFGALCGLMCERSGIINIGIEGMMLMGAFFAFMGSALLRQFTGAAWPQEIYLIFGLVTAMLGTALIASLHAVLSIKYKIDQVISGTVINILAVGITNYVANVYIDPNHLQSAGVFANLNIPVLSKIPFIGPILFTQQPMVYVMLILVIFFQYAVFHTPWGLRTRAVGEHPRAADTVGINVIRVRYLNVILGGFLAGIGGAVLVLESVGRFEKLVTNGRGFIALAVLIFGQWTSVGSLGAALLFGFSEALGVRLQFNDVNHLKALTLIAGLGALLLVLFLLGQRFLNRAQKSTTGWLTIITALIGTILTFASQVVQFPPVVIPIEFLGLLPYLLSILVLAGYMRRATPPSAIGKPYEK
jgi:simple sugar transport system permease protein